MRAAASARRTTTIATAGAEIANDARQVFDAAEMIVKVKEPQAAERAMLRRGPDPLHLPPPRARRRADRATSLKSGVTGIAYETVTDPSGALPLLKPMSQVAGRMSIQAGATALEKAHGGRGVLLGGVPGVQPGKVVILGGGVVGYHAAENAVGLSAPTSPSSTAARRRSSGCQGHFGAKARVLYSSTAAIAAARREADLVIGAVLVPGAEAPKLVTRDMLKTMKPGAVLVDVAIDQGGCFETSHATTHAEPTYVVDGIVHYCVANMPGAVARTSHLRAQQRHPAPRRAARQPRLAGGAAADKHLLRGAQRLERPGDVQGGGRGAGPRLHAGGDGARLRMKGRGS